jgi:hypothetical protein
MPERRDRQPGRFDSRGRKLLTLLAATTPPPRPTRRCWPSTADDFFDLLPHDIGTVRALTHLLSDRVAAPLAW